MNADLWILLAFTLVMLAIAPIVPLFTWLFRRRPTLDTTSAIEDQAAARINNSNHPSHTAPHPTFTATNGWTVEIIEPIGAAPYIRATKDNLSCALAIPPLYQELERAIVIDRVKRMGLLRVPDDAADAFCEFLIHLAKRLRVRS